MCLIIHKPQGKTIPPEWITEAAAKNPHGWGIMSTRKNRLLVTKGLNMNKLPKALYRYGDAELFVHLRFATHGNRDVDNCHPFVICQNRFAVMHNGIFDIDTESDKKKSDTWHYCQSILEPVLADYVFDTDLCSAMEMSIGHSNKLAILCHDGRSMIVGRKQGGEKDGCWLSNLYSVQPDLWLPWEQEDHSCRRDDKEYIDLEDLAWLPDYGLEELCMDHPHIVAKAIREYFTYSELKKDYR